MEADISTLHKPDILILRRHSSLILLSLRTLLSKMPVITVGNQGLIPRGTFREHFTFHSWQAEMDCRAAFERVPTRGHALRRSRFRG
jgi:hypothetical protein